MAEPRNNNTIIIIYIILTVVVVVVVHQLVGMMAVVELLFAVVFAFSVHATTIINDSAG